MSLFLSLTLWRPSRCHNVAGSKIIASQPANHAYDTEMRLSGNPADNYFE